MPYLQGTRRALIGSSVTAPPVVIVTDSFDRADNAASMGSADSGQVWTPFAVSGTVSTYGIQTNRAYCVANGSSGSNDMTRLATSASNCTITSNILMPTNASARRIGLIFRYVDDTNYLKLEIRPAANAMRFYSVVASVETILLGIAPGFVDTSTYEITVILNGTSLKCYRDDILILDTTSAVHQSGTGVGLWVDQILNNGGRWLDLLVTTP
jgi:hypothetical protein